MKKRLFISQLVKVIAFGLIFIYLFNYSYKVLSWKEGTSAYTSAATTLYDELDDDIVDVLFLGSSHCYASISNTQLWDEHGIGAFNMVISGQDLASSYYYMREVFKTQTPKVVCVELFGSTFEKHAVTANIYRNTLSMKYSNNYINLVDAVAPEEDKEDYLLKWPIIHTRYRELHKGDFTSSYPVYLGGDASNKNITDVGDLFVYQGDETAPVYESNEKWIQKIVDFAKENNTELCFFVVPYVADEYTQKQFRYIEQMLEKQNVPVVNFFDKLDEIDFNSHTDFSDAGHTNEYGAAKITKYMGKYLKDNYNLTDHRGDERYAIWEENSIFSANKTTVAELRNTYSIDKYFEKLSQADDYTVIIASNGNHLDPQTDISDCFELIGVDGDFAISGGACIVNNGNVEYITNEKEYSYWQDISEGAVSLNRSGDISVITINRKVYKVVDNGFNVVVYDNASNKVIDCIGFNMPKHYDGDR